MIPALAVALAAYSGVVDLSDRTGVALRTFTGQQTALDVVNQPIAALSLTDRRTNLAATYAPFVFAQDLEQGTSAPTPALYQTGSLGVAWHDRFTRLSLREEASYGRENTAYFALPRAVQTPTTPGAPAPPSPTIQLLPQPATIDLESSRTALATDLRLSRRFLLSLDVGYALYGGANAESRNVVPFQSGPYGDATGAYALDHNDALVVRAHGAKSDTQRAPCLVGTGVPLPAVPPTCAPDSLFADGTASLDHAFTRATNGSVGVGAAFVRSRLNPTDRYTSVVYPTGLASYNYRFGFETRPALLHMDAQLGPTIDTRTGLADYRLQANAALTRTMGYLSLSEALGATRSLGNMLLPPNAFLVSTTTAEYRASRHVLLAAVLNCALQYQDGLGTDSTIVALVSVTFRTSPVHF